MPLSSIRIRPVTMHIYRIAKHYGDLARDVLAVGHTRLVAAVVLASPLLLRGATETINPITVCQVIAAPEQFKDKTVILVGKLIEDWEGTWISEAKCRKHIVSGTYVWPNEAWVSCCYEPAPDPPPPGLLSSTKSALAKALAKVKRRTRISIGQSREDPNNSVPCIGCVTERWVVIYGRIELREQLTQPSGVGPGGQFGNGFGHMASAPIQVVAQRGCIWELHKDGSTATLH